MLIVSNLSKSYDKTFAVKNISFHVADGEIAVLLGPNGAGKSTTIKCITGLLKYEGEIEICGFINKSLDPKAIKELNTVFLELKQAGTTVIISTHIINSVEEIWDRALIMKEGNIVMARTRQELLDKNESLENIFFDVTEGN